jgi:hypothetical protein
MVDFDADDGSRSGASASSTTMTCSEALMDAAIDRVLLYVTDVPSLYRIEHRQTSKFLG